MPNPSVTIETAVAPGIRPSARIACRSSRMAPPRTKDAAWRETLTACAGPRSDMRYSPPRYGSTRPLVDALRVHARDVRRLSGHSERLAPPAHAAHVAHQRDLRDRARRVDPHRRRAGVERPDDSRPRGRGRGDHDHRPRVST